MDVVEVYPGKQENQIEKRNGRKQDAVSARTDGCKSKFQTRMLEVGPLVA